MTLPVRETGKTYNVLFYCSTSVPGYKLVHNSVYPQIAADYERSFALADHLECDVFLANHHGILSYARKAGACKTRRVNPFIDPAEYRAFVHGSHEEFKAELARQRAVRTVH